jgi:Starch binding domain/Domain of unknown function (DUF5110)
VYASSIPSSFTLHEDDGQTVAYQGGAFGTTPLTQQLSGAAAATTETVIIGATSGAYTGAPASRNNVVELVAENARANSVTLNGASLPQLISQAAFDGANSGWFNAGNNLILAKTGSLDVTAAKTVAFTLAPSPPIPPAKFICNNGATTWGQSVYVVGNIPALGNWAPANGVKLNPDGPYPTWTGTAQVPSSAAIQWKCIKRPENADNPVVWQPDPNNSFTSSASGGVTTTGDFAGGAVTTEQFICDNGTTTWGSQCMWSGAFPASETGIPIRRRSWIQPTTRAGPARSPTCHPTRLFNGNASSKVSALLFGNPIPITASPRMMEGRWARPMALFNPSEILRGRPRLDGPTYVDAGGPANFSRKR